MKKQEEEEVANTNGDDIAEEIVIGVDGKIVEINERHTSDNIQLFQTKSADH